MNIRCVPNKQIFSNWESNYRVISCYPIGSYPELELNNYGNFTISGSNLTDIQLYQETEVSIRKDNHAKYPASYIMIGVPDMLLDNEKIIIPEGQNYNILCRFMEASQARYVDNAYPNFCQMVVNGEEEKIDYHNIYNVGKVRIEQYIDKVKNERDKLLLIPKAAEYGIESMEDVTTLTDFFTTATSFEEAIKENPYHIYYDMLKYNWNKTDKLVINKFPDLIDSTLRCEYGCIDILKKNENEGDTKINANLLAHYVKEIAPEAMKEIVNAVTNSEKIYYDPETKFSSLANTYLAELNIATEIKKRVNNPIIYNMNWEEYVEVDGFHMTEEQSKILELACSQSVMMLNGSAGTGKSTSMKALVRMLEANGKSYTILAPTGIAAKRISFTTGRTASTIHKFLASSNDYILGDYVIIDEMSMVGVELLSALFNRLQEKTKIVFICDEAQLASISCGNIVQDIIDSNIVPIAKLTKVFRYGIGGIATIATDTRMGEKFSPPYQFDDYEFIPIAKNAVKQVAEKYNELIVKGYKSDDIMILCPFNKSKIGSYLINNEIQSQHNFSPSTKAKYKRDSYDIELKVGDKIINTQNNYNATQMELTEENTYVESEAPLAIMNGDIGYVRAYRENNDFPELLIQYDNGLALAKSADIKNLLLGYSISIHKSQGSQAKIVIVVIDKSHKGMCSRNLLYVALSRAQEKLIEIGDVDVINDALQIQEEKERETWLKDLLTN